MSSLIRWLDRHTNLMRILYVFWMLFWGLNGADKFFNDKQRPNLSAYAASSVLVDNRTKLPVYTQHPIEPTGVFGVTRDNKMAGYFARLGVPREVAIGCLNLFAVAEILLGLGFGALALWSLLPLAERSRTSGLWGIFTDRTVHRLCFKGSALIFVVFSAGDTLFGDRIELWEHGTFMLLTLITYDLWYRTDQFVTQKELAEQPAPAPAA
ncbi:MAG: hypothetical protein EXR73_00855 [Myxococcales bacterium]|nr:hypothetical protein [Myxococcales bacterium]